MKRGILELGWGEVIGITLVVLIIVFAIAPFFGRLLGIFLGTGATEAAAKANLVALTIKINQIANEPEPFFVIDNFPYGLPAGKFILIAFNHGEETSTSTCDSRDFLGGIFSGAEFEVANRPEDCKIGTCLCLYKESRAGIDLNEKPILCQELTRDIIFIAPGNKEEPCATNQSDNVIPCMRNEYIGPAISAVGKQEQPIPQLPQGYSQIATWQDGWNFGVPVSSPNHPLLKQPYDYENLVLYGSCEVTTWNVQRTYIEKFTIGDKKYMFISRHSEFTEKRYNLSNEAQRAAAAAQIPVS